MSKNKNINKGDYPSRESFEINTIEELEILDKLIKKIEKRKLQLMKENDAN